MKKYIFGLFTGIALLPIIDSLVELIQVSIEVPKGLISKKVLKINSELSDLQMQNEPISTSCIGFEAPQEYDEYDFDEE